MIKLVISKDFTETPGARFIIEGSYSGEEFRNDFLEPKYLEAKIKKEKLVIDFDGGYGYATSFLEEAFGGLARKYDEKEIKEVLEFKSDDEPSLIFDIIDYIKNARN